MPSRSCGPCARRSAATRGRDAARRSTRAVDHIGRARTRHQQLRRRADALDLPDRAAAEPRRRSEAALQRALGRPRPVDPAARPRPRDRAPRLRLGPDGRRAPRRHRRAASPSGGRPARSPAGSHPAARSRCPPARRSGPPAATCRPRTGCRRTSHPPARARCALRLSGPVTAAYAVPSCSQNTSPQVSVATAVISATCSLRHVHTDATHGESETRVPNSSPTVGS